MISFRPDRPYFDAWLRRTSKQFAVSGRLSQTALILAQQEGGTQEEWRSCLLTLLDGQEPPSLDLLTKIDTILAGPSRENSMDENQGSLF